MRAGVEKEIMKLQNKQIKLGEEIKNLLSMREGFNARFSALDSIYLQVKDFEKQIIEYATIEQIVQVRREIDKCADNSKTVSLFDKIERNIESLTRRVNNDFVTNDNVARMFRD